MGPLIISRRRVAVGLSLVAGLVVALGSSACQDAGSGRGRGRRAAPVAVAEVARGRIVLRRVYSGTLEAPARFVVAPKIRGRIEHLAVDIGDPVERNQVVAELDDDELTQAVAQAEAELAVTKANLKAARSALAIAARDLERVQTLRRRGVSSESQLDTARATRLARQAELDVATAEVTRAEAAVDATRVRLAYTEVRAVWSGGESSRVVAERFVAEGALVAENAPLLSIVELNPLRSIIFVAEKDYGRLEVGLRADLATDAYPGERFVARVARIAPVFEPGSRQARVELVVDNPDGRLKPGMFVRATVALETVDDAVIVPFAAVTSRDDEEGVFITDDAGDQVRWVAVELGIREGNRVQIRAPALKGRVVTLGQQLIDDGSKISIPGSAAQPVDPEGTLDNPQQVAP